MRTSTLAAVVAGLFAMDSAFKISLPGLRIHFGHLSLLVLLPVMLLNRSNIQRTADFVKANKTLLLLGVYLLSHAFLAQNIGVYSFVLTYFLLSLATYYFFFLVAPIINYQRLFSIMLLAIVASGFFQYALYVAFGYQLSFGGIDPSYYQAGGTIAYRMRGFFLEPNWFGLFLCLCYIGFLGTIDRLNQRVVAYSIMVAICVFLSGNRLVSYFFMLSILFFFFRKNSNFLVSAVVVIVSTFPVWLFLWAVGAHGAEHLVEEDRSLVARTATAARVVNYAMTNFSVNDWMFGKGFSNWASYALEHEITINTSAIKATLTTRDSSESYVVMFELGVLGVVLILSDLIGLAKRASKKNAKAGTLGLLGIMLVLVSAFFYPIYFFMMYLVPFFLIRAWIIGAGHGKRSSIYVHT